MDKDTEYTLIKAAKSGDQSAIDKLVLSNSGLIIKYLRKCKLYNNYTSEDAYNDGVIGLIDAIRTFDLESGHRYSTWATQWIKAHIYRQSIYNSNVITLPADHIAEVKAGKSQHIDEQSMDITMDSEGTTFADYYADPSSLDFEQDIANMDTSSVILKCINKLPEDRRYIIIAHYVDNISQIDIAKKMDKPLPWVKWNIQQARKKLKDIILDDIDLRDVFTT